MAEATETLVGASKTILFEGAAGELNAQYHLNESYKNFDYLLVCMKSNESEGLRTNLVIPTEDIHPQGDYLVTMTSVGEGPVSTRFVGNTGLEFLFPSEDIFKFIGVNGLNCPKLVIYKILGIKYQSTEPLTNYEIAVKNGFVGTEQQWLDSLLVHDNIRINTINYDTIFSGSASMVGSYRLSKAVTNYNFLLVCSNSSYSINSDYIPILNEYKLIPVNTINYSGNKEFSLSAIDGIINNYTNQYCVTFNFSNTSILNINSILLHGQVSSAQIYKIIGIY